MCAIVSFEYRYTQQEEIALWKVSKAIVMYDWVGTTGMRLNIGVVYTIETGLSNHERVMFLLRTFTQRPASEKKNKKVNVDQCLQRW